MSGPVELTVFLADEQLDALAVRVAALLDARAPAPSGPGEGEPALTVAQAAARAGVSERTVRRAVAAGRLEAVRMEGVRSVRIPAAALDGWARSGPAAPAPAVSRRRKAHGPSRVLRDALGG